MDGVGISLARAVIAHDFVDGFNTFNPMLARQNTTQRALILLFFDALAPVLARPPRFGCGCRRIFWRSISAFLQGSCFTSARPAFCSKC